MVLNIATFGKGITISLCVIVYVVKAGQRHIVIDIAGLQRREMYVAMATNNGLSIQHDVLPIFFLEHTYTPWARNPTHAFEKNNHH